MKNKTYSRADQHCSCFVKNTLVADRHRRDLTELHSLTAVTALLTTNSHRITAHTKLETTESAAVTTKSAFVTNNTAPISLKMIPVRFILRARSTHIAPMFALIEPM
jgi:hypothetical protein